MKVLLVEYVHLGHTKVWDSEASILAKHSDATAIVLAIGDSICALGSPYLRKRSDNFGYELTPRCAGIIEATDQEVEILASAGYQLTDLRSAVASELLKSI